MSFQETIELVGKGVDAAEVASLRVLAIIVVIWTFLSFSPELEITGRWPWQKKNTTTAGAA